MPEAQKNPPESPARRRADAERSIARILDAAVDALGRDPDASMAQIASRAGVVRRFSGALGISRLYCSRARA